MGIHLDIIPKSQHIMRNSNVAPNAIKVLQRLNDAGYEAYLVGGGVRDVLLGKHPKDFDIATSAHPEDVKAIFPNCRLIGRRFRLAHVRFGREIIEVATFRAAHPQQQNHPHAEVNETSGLVVRDNVYGNAEEDAIRRDFTVNALYFDIRDESVRDYTGGVKDLENRTLKLIGDPEARYREDPVRMLRAIRFAAKLGFQIDPDTEAPIHDLGPLLLQIPAARMFEEFQKLFLSGHAMETYQWMRRYGLFRFLFPLTEECYEDLPWYEAMVEQALINTDTRLSQGKPVTPYFLLGVLLWGPVKQRQKRFQDKGIPPHPALHKSAQSVIHEQTQATSIPKRFALPMREVWELQPRLPKRAGQRAEQLHSLPRFRAAYDFLLLREHAGELKPGLGDWWTQYQEANPEERRHMANKVAKPPKKRRRRKKKPAQNATSPTPNPD